MKLYEKIYTLRTEKNLSQGDLAEMLDVSRQSVSKWETGASVPDLDKLIKMKEIFGVSIDELVCEDIVKKTKEELTDPTMKTEPAPQIVVVKEALPMWKFVGILLFFCAFFMLLLRFSYTTPAILTIMGVLCLVCRKRAWLWCLWVSFFTLGQFFTLSLFEAFRFRWYGYYIERGQFWKHFGPAWLYVIGFVIMLALTVWSFRQVTLHPTRKKAVMFGVGWGILLVISPIMETILSLIETAQKKLWILNPDEVSAGAPPMYSAELHQAWVKIETWFYDVYVILFVSAFTALLVLTVSLIRTHRKKKVSVPNEAI